MNESYHNLIFYRHFNVELAVMIYANEMCISNNQGLGAVIISKKKNIYKKAPLAYINRVKMEELMIEKSVDNKTICYYHPESDRDRRKHIILSADSELFRIIRHLSGEKKTRKKRMYIPEILSLKVGNSYRAYKDALLQTDATITYDGIQYKRIIVSSSHSRTQKAMMVAVDLWDKAVDILTCGLDRDLEFTYMSKWNAYIGLAATDSIPVSMPNIVVVPDLEMPISDHVDIVKEINTESGKVFEVINNQIVDINTNLFDGAGLVSVERSARWSKELNLDYIPSSYQFRCIPCLKGKLYTFDLKKFADTYNTGSIIDVWGNHWDLQKDNIDCIMTKSQFKFISLYGSYQEWLEHFQEEIHGYRRTFNISAYDEDYDKLQHQIVMAYQMLQTLDLSNEDIQQLCEPTCQLYQDAYGSVEGFLKFRCMSACNEVKDINKDWSKYPSYYQAMYHNHSLFHDDFIRKKINDDLLNFKKRAYVGKIVIDGNYQTLLPDLFALAQHVFSLTVTGLFEHGNEVYSYYWNHRLSPDSWVDIIRSPHIAREHCPAKVVTSQMMEQWFQYQKTGIILSVFDNTIALKLNSADFDGDHVLTTNNEVLLHNLLHVKKNQSSNTIYHLKPETESTNKKICVSDMGEAIECDYKGYKNNIGNVINPISILWSMPQNPSIQDNIKIMSIVGSLTIDYAKHGEEAPIPQEINDILKGCNKPYFMKYLKSNRKKAVQEKVIAKTQSIMGDDEDVELFSDTDCTMNRLCHFMETNIKKNPLHILEDTSFDFTGLLHKMPDVTTHKYKRIRDRLSMLQDDFNDICGEAYRDPDVSSDELYERRNQYKDFFECARYDLVSIENDVSRLLDYLVAIYYSDKKFMPKYKDKSILWGSFPEEMIKRATADFSSIDIDMDAMSRRAEKAKKNLQEIKAYKEKHFRIKDFDACNDVTVNLYKEDIAWIKHVVSTKEVNYLECRKLLLVLIYAYRKCQRDIITILQHKMERINYRSLSRLAGIDARTMSGCLKLLNNLGVICLSKSKNHNLQIEVLKTDEECCSIREENISYNRLPTICNNYFREKTPRKC